MLSLKIALRFLTKDVSQNKSMEICRPGLMKLHMKQNILLKCQMMGENLICLLLLFYLGLSGSKEL